MDEEGNWVDRPFIDGNDNNYNAYNLDIFYTWDFMYGSRFILGWKNWLPQDAVVDGSRYSKYGENARQTLLQPQGREITARLIYFLDHRSMRRK